MNSAKPLIVALEGLDGAGKSTLATHLAQDLSSHLDTKIIHTPIHDVKPLAMQLRGVNKEASFLAFLIGNIVPSSSLERQQVLIFDRYILSTIVHHWSVFLRFELEIPDLLKVLGVRPADFTIFLDVDPSLAWTRISTRIDDSSLALALNEQRETFLSALKNPIANSLIGETLFFANDSFEQMHYTASQICSRILKLSVGKSIAPADRKSCRS